MINAQRVTPTFVAPRDPILLSCGVSESGLATQSVFIGRRGLAAVAVGAYGPDCWNLVRRCSGHKGLAAMALWPLGLSVGIDQLFCFCLPPTCFWLRLLGFRLEAVCWGPWVCAFCF